MAFDPVAHTNLDSKIAAELFDLKESEKFKNILESEGLHAWLFVSESAPNVFNITHTLMIAFSTTWLVEAQRSETSCHENELVNVYY